LDSKSFCIWLIDKPPLSAILRLAAFTASTMVSPGGYHEMGDPMGLFVDRDATLSD
jgi:hypothetical protein